VICRCDCGNVRELSLTNLSRGITTNCADRAHHIDPRHRGEEVTYGTAHHRVAKRRGSASQHSCARCGGQAGDWAYSHADPDERADSAGKDAGKAYSVELTHYEPLCRSCHRRTDNAHRRMSGGGLRLAPVALWFVSA
jgi:hypothetical protein